MKKITYLFILFLYILSFFIVINGNISATSIEGSYTKIHCNVNISYIENNLCEEENCSPIIEKDNYGYWYYIDNTFGILIDEDVLYVYTQNISEKVIDFIIPAIKEDIKPVLNYIIENNLTGDWNDFYNYQPCDKYGHKIIKIDNIWYLDSHSYIRNKDNSMEYVTGFSYCFFLVPIVIFEVLILGTYFFPPLTIMILISILVILVYFISKKRMIKLYLLPIFLGFLGGIIGLIYYYRKYKNKKIGLILFLIGLFESIILYIFYFYLII